MARKAGPGVPTRLTPEVHAKICDAMKIGCYQYEAAQYAGIGENTLVNWLRRGREDLAGGRTKTLHATFLADFEAAEAQAVVRALSVVQRAAASGDWRAAMGWLSRRHPGRWADRQHVTAEVAVDAGEFAKVVGELAALARSHPDGENEGP